MQSTFFIIPSSTRGIMMGKHETTHVKNKPQSNKGYH